MKHTNLVEEINSKLEITQFTPKPYVPNKTRETVGGIGLAILMVAALIGIITA